MKILPILLFLSVAIQVRAADFAILSIQFPGEKALKTVTIELHPEDAPQTVANFEELARKKFYKGMAFHRALPHRLVQVGDPTSKKAKSNIAVGTGGPGWVIPAEIKRRHELGAVAMGRLPNNINPNKSSNGSQFYVCLSPLPTLNGEYTVFGQVTSGLDVLQAIGASPVDSNDAPLKRFIIRGVKIEKH